MFYKFKRMIIFNVVMSFILIFSMLIYICMGNEYKVFAVENVDNFTTQLQSINNLYGDMADCRLIVKSNYDVLDSSAASIASGLGDLHILQYNSRQEAEKASEKFKNKRGIKSVEFDKEISLEQVEDKSLKTETGEDFLSWGGEILGIKDYQNHILAQKQTLKDVYVVVIDTGIDTDHEFLRGRINLEYGKSFAKSINTSSDYPFEDDMGHGTHVAGTIVDLTLDNVKIIPVKVLNSTGFGALSGILSAMEYSVYLKQNEKLNVVATNMSLGGEGEVDKRMKDFIDNAYENNILTVAAAGNSGYYAETEFPGASSNAITISAFGKNNIYRNFPIFANYSNYGSVVDLCLPGSSIVSCIPSEYEFDGTVISSTGFKYVALSGTSMATPHASALVALLATSMGDEFSASKAEELLKSNTYDFGEIGKDDLFGYGVPYLSASIEENSFDNPTLSYGEFGISNSFERPFNLQISYPQQSYLVKYTLDGSIPTFNIDTAQGDIEISESSLVKIIVYKLDENSRPIDMSPIYEVEYLESGHTLNDNGVGFSITQDGVINGYHSGLKDIVLPSEINGINVKKLANNVFYGLPIKSFVCEYDITCGDFPFWSCDSLQYLKLFTTKAQKITRFCYSLKELYLPKLTAILPSPSMKSSSYANGYQGSETFSKSFNLKTIDLSSISVVPKYCFSGYKKLENIILDWENLKEIQAYSFHNTTSYNANITAYLVENVEEYAFSGSGIVGFAGKRAETIGDNAFSDCVNLRSIQLPNVKSLGAWLISRSDNLNYIMIGPYINQYKASSLQTISEMTIYCYNTDISIFSGFNTISLMPQIIKIDAPQLHINLTGYDLKLKVYKSSDESLDQNDLLVKEETFSGVNVNTSYIYDELFIGKNFYIFTLSDKYDNATTLVEEYLYEAKQPHKLTINSNVEGCGIISPKSYYTEGEEVIIVKHVLDGYELTNLTIDGQPLSFEGRYTFLMPDHDVEINAQYTQIHYSISTIVEGSGSIKVKDENGQEIEEATFGQKVYVEFTPDNGFYLDSAFYMASGLKEEITRKEYFYMPCTDIEIVVYFLSPELKDFEFVSRGEGKIGIKKYTGDEEYIYLPQYHIMNGQKYRVVSIAEGCFFGNTTLKSISMEFEDDNNDIEIEKIAFSGCTSLERVSLGKIIKIADGAFRNCQMLSIIDLSHCQEIGEDAFNSCYSLKQVNLKSCNILGKRAFFQGGLAKVTGFKVENVPESAFAQNSGLTSINLSYCISIENYAFQKTGLRTIDLKSCFILGEGGGQFQSCLSLQTVKNLKASVLPENIFAQCYSLNDIDLENVKTIRQYAFNGCKDICEINLKNVDNLEYRAFDDNDILRIYLDDNIKIFNNNFPKVGYVYVYKYAMQSSLYSNYLSVKATAPSYYAFYREFGDYIVYTRDRAFVVTFKFDGSTVISKDLYHSSDVITVPKTYVDENYTYTLQSWYIEGDNTFTVLPENIATISVDTTFVVKEYLSEDNKYQITYYYGYDFDDSGDINDEGDIFLINMAKKGENIILPQNIISREMDEEYEYIFVGWMVDGVEIDGSYVINGDVSVVAKYSLTKRKYTVSWLNRDGSVIYSEQVEYGTIPQFDMRQPLPTAYRDDYYLYTFNGWGEILPVSKNVSYSPQYRREFLTYRIYFYYGYDFNNNGFQGDDGDIFKIVEYNLNSLVQYPSCSHSHGGRGMQYVFRCWEKSNLEGLYISDILDEFDENLILKLNAIYDEIPVQYTINWIDGDGNVIYSEKYLYNQTPSYNIEIYGTPTKQETEQYTYQFTGWEPDIVAVTRSTSYNATFNQSIKGYTVTWVDEEEQTIYQEIVEYGQIPVFDGSSHQLPSKSPTNNFHFVFKEWSYTDIITSDVIIKPVFDWFNIIKNVDQTMDTAESYSILGASSARINLVEVNKSKNLRIKIDDIEILLSSKLLSNIDDVGTLEVVIKEENVKLDSKYKQVRAFSLNMKLNDDDLLVSDSVKVTINGLYGYDKHARVLVEDDEIFQDIDFQFKNNSATFELLNLGVFAVAYLPTNGIWLEIILIISGILLVALCFIIYFVRRRKKSMFNDDF